MSDLTLTREQREKLIARAPTAYYYEFERTGVPAIDAILSAVAWAGKGWHSTADWNGDPDIYSYGVFDGISPIDIIQAAANDAARECDAAQECGSAGTVS